MPVLQDNPWRITYGTFVFPLYSKSSIAGKPVYDSARRAVKYISYTLTVESHITASPDEDVEVSLEQIRQQLQSRGQTLEIVNTGFGHLRVNDPVNKVAGVDVRDVAYGPHPEILEVRPLACRLAWDITWRCTFNVPECAEGTAVFAGRPMAFTYTWDITQDTHGFTTRTVAGELEIPATVLPGVKVPPDQADKYWESIVASLPPISSFTRESHRTLSEDRRTPHFTITDKELPINAFVSGATEWTGTQEMGTDRGSGFRTWTCSITATYQVARGRNKGQFFQRFMDMVGSRQRQAKLFKSSALPLDLRISDQLHGQEVSFTYRWTTLLAWDDAIKGAGMWLPLTDFRWVGWGELGYEHGEVGTGGAGNAKLAYSAASDTLIDLCDDGKAKQANPPNLGTARVASSDNFAPQPTLPPPDMSWMHYASHMVYAGDQGVAEMRVLPAAPAPRLGQKPPTTPGGIRLQDPSQSVSVGSGSLSEAKLSSLGSIVYPVVPPDTSTQKNTLQRRALPSARVFLRGEALRAGYPIEAPKLLSVGGVTATLLRPYFVWGIVADAAGIPIIGAKWNHEYVLPQEPSGLLLPPNPLYGL